MWPMVASVPVLHTLGRHHAFENLLTGDPFEARRAYEIGIVNEVVPADRLRASIDAWVTRVDEIEYSGPRSSFRRAVLVTAVRAKRWTLP